jgi:tight adherence protein B
MRAVLPALLAAAAVAVLLGWPAPSRPVWPRPRPSPPVLAGLLGGPRPPGGPDSGDCSRAGPLPGWLPPTVAGLALLMVGGPAAAAIGVALAVAGHRAWLRRADRRRREAERSGAAEALAVLASELRAGRPADLALDAAATVAAGPLAATLRSAAGASRFGAEPAAVLRGGAGRSAVPEVLRGLAACWQVCSATGSSLATAVDRLAEAVRADRAQRAAVEAELAGPRATAALLAVLPLAGLALAAGLGADPLHVLLHTPFGAGCLLVGVGLDLLGLWWTGRLVAAAGGC